MKDNPLNPQEDVSLATNIYQKIEEKGLLDAKAIVDAGRSRKDEMVASMLKEFAEHYDNQIAKANTEQDQRIRSFESKFEQRTRQERLVVQKELIDQVFARVLVKLNSFNDQQYKDLVLNLIKAHKIKGNEEIAVSSSDYGRFVRIFASGKKEHDELVLDKLNQILPNANLTLSKEAVNIKGGFIIIGKYFDIDLSFESLFEELKKNYETELSNILFLEGK